MAEKPKTEKKQTGQDEKVLVIPLRREARRSAKNMRKNRSVRAIRAFLARHMRTDPSNVSISQQLNEHLWKGGLHNNLASIKVKVKTGEEGKVLVSMLDERERPKKEKRRLGLRQRLRRKEAAEPKPAKPAPEAPKEIPKKEKPKEPAPEEAAQLTPEEPQ
jgi:large subunit ribosomal protein L31e